MSESENNLNDISIFNKEDLDKELNLINSEKDKVFDYIDILSLEQNSSKKKIHQKFMNKIKQNLINITKNYFKEFI